MQTKIFAIYDNKAEAFMAPFTAINAGMALRSFADNVNQPDSIFGRHPNDFCMYELGTFDDKTGMVEAYEQAKNLGFAIDYINTETPQQLRTA